MTDSRKQSQQGTSSAGMKTPAEYIDREYFNLPFTIREKERGRETDRLVGFLRIRFNFIERNLLLLSNDTQSFKGIFVFDYCLHTKEKIYIGCNLTIKRQRCSRHLFVVGLEPRETSDPVPEPAANNGYDCILWAVTHLWIGNEDRWFNRETMNVQFITVTPFLVMELFESSY